MSVHLQKFTARILHFGNPAKHRLPQLLSGVGAPVTTAGTETGDAPNGSIYINQEGADATHTLYLKAAGAWTAK